MGQQIRIIIIIIKKKVLIILIQLAIRIRGKKNYIYKYSVFTQLGCERVPTIQYTEAGKTGESKDE